MPHAQGRNDRAAGAEPAATAVAALPLGQSGFSLRFGGTHVVIDPYLSDRVAALHGEDDLRRLTPPPLAPGELTGVDWVLITHAHADHCDPETLLPLAAASPRARFLAPFEALERLAEWGVPRNRLRKGREEWIDAAPDLGIRPLVSAHPEAERDHEGDPRYLGYALRWGGRLLYHAGDTSPHDEVLAALAGLGPVEVAFLPVNEPNYFRARRGIVGNMTLREAFQMAAEIRARTLVPIHWDLFAPNSLHREEIELLYAKERPPFRLLFEPREL